MLRKPSLLALASLAFGLFAAAPARAQTDKDDKAAEAIIRSSDWDIVIDGLQKAGIRIRAGVIYPGDTRLNNPVGEAIFVATGKLYLRFINHPKVAPGEATVVKVANGQWAGPLLQPGLERHMALKRR